MRRRKEVEESKWRNTEAYKKAIPLSLPTWEERDLHAFREVIRRQLGYIASKAQLPDEDLKEAKRILADWMEAAPFLDLQHTLILIEHELARRNIASPDAPAPAMQ